MSNTIIFKEIFLTIVIILFSLNLFSQSPKDSIKFTQSTAFKIGAIPTILITSSLILFPDNDFFDRFDILEFRQKNIPNFQNHTDDYLQYAPIAGVYGLRLLGVKGQNDLRDATLILLKSEIFMMALVFPLKEITKLERPDGSANTAYPSGHTAQAFVAATFMHKEYGHLSPWYSIGAYTVASSVAVLRILNNRHWVSDVLAGAGIGILTTNIAYVTHRFRWSNRKKKVSIIPAYFKGHMSLDLVIPINYATLNKSQR